MKTSIALALVSSCMLVLAAAAQAPASTTPAASAPAPAPSSPAAPPPPGPVATAPATTAPAMPTGTAGTRPKAKEVRETCRTSAKADGLKGDAMRKVVSDCVVRERPDLAGREQCRTDGFAKGLRKDDLRAFVKECAKGKS